MVSIPFWMVWFFAAKEILKWVFFSEKTEPGMIRTLFLIAVSTKTSPFEPSDWQGLVFGLSVFAGGADG